MKNLRKSENPRFGNFNFGPRNISDTVIYVGGDGWMAVLSFIYTYYGVAIFSSSVYTTIP